MANKFILEGTGIEIEHVYDGPKLALMVGIKYDDKLREDIEIPQKVLDSSIEIIEKRVQLFNNQEKRSYGATRYLAAAINQQYKEYTTVDSYSGPAYNTKESYIFEVNLQLDEYSRRLILQFKSSGMRSIDFIKNIDEYVMEKLVMEEYPGVWVSEDGAGNTLLKILMADEKGCLKKMEFADEHHWKLKDAIIGVRLVGFKQDYDQ